MTVTQETPDLIGTSGAELSDCGRYRHRLWRVWDPTLPVLGWVMLNPSTADGTVDDPTIRRCIGFARRERFGAIEVANLFQLRATDPRELLVAGWEDALGPDDLDPIDHVADHCRLVVAAWGSHHHAFDARAREIGGRLIQHARDVAALGTTRDGHPRHPLYVRADQPLVEWEVPT